MLSIAALKKVSKGTRILLLDRNGGQAKSIAKALAKKGFKRVRPAFPLAQCSALWSSPHALIGELHASAPCRLL